MTTTHNLVVAFNATETQKELLKQFCADKKEEEHVIAITQNIDSKYVISLSFFAQRPSLYFGIYSREDKQIVRDYTLSDEVLKIALKRLEKKFAFNTTRQTPVEIDEVVLAWVKYINKDFNDEKIPLD